MSTFLPGSQAGVLKIESALCAFAGLHDLACLADQFVKRADPVFGRRSVVTKVLFCLQPGNGFDELLRLRLSGVSDCC